MKFRLLERDKQIDYDIWHGRLQFYYARIEKPYREDHPDFHIYSFRIRTPQGEVITSAFLNCHFTNLADCRTFIVKWIKNESKARTC